MAVYVVTPKPSAMPAVQPVMAPLRQASRAASPLIRARSKGRVIAVPLLAADVLPKDEA